LGWYTSAYFAREAAEDTDEQLRMVPALEFTSYENVVQAVCGSRNRPAEEVIDADHVSNAA
jgi:hypothetical protein